jgi:hypothetical protein
MKNKRTSDHAIDVLTEVGQATLTYTDDLVMRIAIRAGILPRREHYSDSMIKEAVMRALDASPQWRKTYIDSTYPNGKPRKLRVMRPIGLRWILRQKTESALEAVAGAINRLPGETGEIENLLRGLHDDLLSLHGSTELLPSVVKLGGNIIPLKPGEKPRLRGYFQEEANEEGETDYSYQIEVIRSDGIREWARITLKRNRLLYQRSPVEGSSKDCRSVEGLLEFSTAKVAARRVNDMGATMRILRQHRRRVPTMEEFMRLYGGTPVPQDTSKESKRRADL